MEVVRCQYATDEEELYRSCISQSALDHFLQPLVSTQSFFRSRVTSGFGHDPQSVTSITLTVAALTPS